MRSDYREARERLLGIKTVHELEELLASLNITDEQREVAMMRLHKGWIYDRIAAETGYSVRQITRIMARVYSKML